jgi:rhodanese-related sulfurtransferase
MSLNTLTMTDTDYQIRAKEFHIDSDDEIREALQRSGTIVLDVRTIEEVTSEGKITDSESFPHHHLIYRQSDCTVEDCLSLRLQPQDFIPNWNENPSAIIVLHCASGRRAALAKEILLQQGYSGRLLNAGGYRDLKRFF